MLYLLKGNGNFTMYNRKDVNEAVVFPTLLDFLSARNINSLDLALERDEYLFEINEIISDSQNIDLRDSERVFTKDSTFERKLNDNPFVGEKYADCFSVFFVDVATYPDSDSVMKITDDSFSYTLKDYWEFKMALKAYDYEKLLEQGVDDKMIIQAFVNEDLRFFLLTENISFLLPKNVDKIIFADSIRKKKITKPLDCAKFLKEYPEKGIEMVFSHIV